MGIPGYFGAGVAAVIARSGSRASPNRAPGRNRTQSGRLRAGLRDEGANETQSRKCESFTDGCRPGRPRLTLSMAVSTTRRAGRRAVPAAGSRTRHRRPLDRLTRASRRATGYRRASARRPRQYGGRRSTRRPAAARRTASSCRAAKESAARMQRDRTGAGGMTRVSIRRP